MVRVLSSSTELDEEIRRAGSAGVIVIDFYADWCGPCRAIAPFFLQLATRYSNVAFFKVNVDHSRDLAGRFSVRAMPTFVVLRAGVEVNRVMGGNPSNLEEVVRHAASTANPNAASLEERNFLEQFTVTSEKYIRYYDDIVYRTLARSVIPAEITDAAEKELSLSVAHELLAWFKHDFFQWIDVPTCIKCKSTPDKSRGLSGTPTKEEKEDGADRVEVYACCCGAEVRFPRYNNPGKLLESRVGRCGEWANCFTLCAASLGFETRYIYDVTDHVWTEIRISDRWIHFDACEEVYDKPLLYEKGWKKQLSYVLAFASDHVADVTWRYVLDAKETKKRRTRVRESLLTSFVEKLSSRILLRKLEREGKKNTLAEKEKELAMRRCAELLDMMRVGERKDEGEYGGRVSGNAEWKKVRGEDGGLPTPTLHRVIEASKDQATNGIFSIEYDIVSDVYRIGGKEERGWWSGLRTAKNVQRKEEKDWKMVYLCREDGAESGEMEWEVALRGEHRPARVTIQLTAFLQKDGARVTAVVCLGDSCNMLRDGVPLQIENDELCGASQLHVKVILEGGRGSSAFQNAQIFRSPLQPSLPLLSIQIHYT